MDSFLEEPRAIPKPTPIIQEIQSPTVPEISLMFENTRKEKAPLPINYGKSVQSYNAWKLSNNSNNNQEYDSFLLAKKPNSNKENLSSDGSLMFKKQVRFENPVLPASPLTEINFKPKYSAESSSTAFNRQSYADFKTAKQTEPKLPNSFEKLYMSNLPPNIVNTNRELDLSILEPQKQSCGPFKPQIFSPYKQYKSTVNSYDYHESYNSYSPKFTRISSGSEISVESPQKIIANKPEPIQSQNLISKVNEIKEKEQNEEVNTQTTSTITVETKDCDNDKTVESSKTIETKTNAISVTDLLAIIKLQNEQLQKLQTQVEKLVRLNEKKTDEKPQPQQTVEQQQTIEIHPETTASSPENGKNISVGVMTSFEVTYKPPLMRKKHKQSRHLQHLHQLQHLQPVEDEDSQNSAYEYREQFPRQYRARPNKKHDYMRKNKRDFQRFQQEKLQYEQQQQERLFYEQEQEREYFEKQHQQRERERQQQQRLQYEQQERKLYEQQQQQQQLQQQQQQQQWKTQETEYSLGSQNSLQIREQPESPENSIHIDMQEYDTDSSDDECSTDEGWTFYKDILGQVNNLLENSPKGNYKTNNPNPPNKFRNEVQQNVQMNPTEVSFAVKQLLMKYMPDDGLANVATNPEDYRKPADISVTAFKYMQQCNVVTNAQQYYRPKGVMKKFVPNSNNPKVLDITTLKQQPKFL